MNKLPLRQGKIPVGLRGQIDGPSEIGRYPLDLPIIVAHGIKAAAAGVFLDAFQRRFPRVDVCFARACFRQRPLGGGGYRLLPRLVRRFRCVDLIHGFHLSVSLA